MELGVLLRADLARASTAFLAHDARLSADLDPEDLHDARVALRRIRSVLRTFRSSFEPEWLTGALAQISWYQTLLGELRDVDVTIAQLLPLDETSVDRSGSAALMALLATDRASALGNLTAGRALARYASAIGCLDELAGAPPMRRRAQVDARDALPDLLARPWRNLRETARVARKAPSDAAIHVVRLRAKELRYASDLAVPVLGEQAAALAKSCARLQGRLGHHHDAVTTTAWLRRAATVAPQAAFLAGQLAVGQQQIAAETGVARSKEMKQIERAWRRVVRDRKR